MVVRYVSGHCSGSKVMEDETTKGDVDNDSVSHLDKKLCQFLDDNLQDDLSNVHQCLERMQKEKYELESQLTFSQSNNMAPSCVDKTLEEARVVLENVDEIQSNLNELNSCVEDHDKKVSDLVDQLESLNNTVKELKHLISYIKWIQKVEDYSKKIHKGLETGSLKKSTEELLNLKELLDELHGSSCKHLKKFVASTLSHWNKIVVEKLSKEFDEVLKVLKWPFTSGSTAPPLSAKPEIFKRLENLFIMLLKVSEIYSLVGEDMTKQPSRISLPLKLLLTPLKKRFLYHFSSKKQTNNLEKPEWFYTQVLNWIRDHQHFLASTIQPIVDKTEVPQTSSVQAQFTEGLLEVVEEKMKQIIPSLLKDDPIFSHFVDETLLFDQELRNVYNYPATSNVCLQVLSQQQCFKKWLTLEKKYAMENVQLLLSSDKAWCPRYQDASDIDDLKVPECVETFVSLLLGITDRFRYLPREQDRLTFVNIQLDLIFFFTASLEEVMEQNATTPLNACFSFILNSTNYIVTVLQDWAEQPLFLKLYYEKRRITKEKKATQANIESIDESNPPVIDDNHDNQDGVVDNQDGAHDNTYVALYDKDGTPDNQDGALDNQDGHLDNQDTVLSNKDGVLSNKDGVLDNKDGLFESFDESDQDENGTLFDDVIVQLQSLQNKMLSILVKHVLGEFKNKSEPYRKESWHSLPSQKDLAITCLSSSLCDMIIYLREILGNLKQELVESLFTCFWKRLADDLSEFLFVEVILKSHFNEGGAAQLKFDIHKNLFVLFGQFTPKPDNYFRRLKEAIVLLNLKPGSAILLKETLEDNTRKKKNKLGDALDELGVYRLTVDEVLDVLNSRINRTK